MVIWSLEMEDGGGVERWTRFAIYYSKNSISFCLKDFLAWSRSLGAFIEFVDFFKCKTYNNGTLRLVGYNLCLILMYNFLILIKTGLYYYESIISMLKQTFMMMMPMAIYPA